MTGCLAAICIHHAISQWAVRTCHHPQGGTAPCHSSANFKATSGCDSSSGLLPVGGLLPGDRCREQIGGNSIQIFFFQLLPPPAMSQPDSVPELWVITGSHSWTGTGQMGSLHPEDKGPKSPFAEEWIPDEQVATLSLDSFGAEETIDLGENAFGEPPPPYKLQVPREKSSCAQSSMPDTCRDHGDQLSLFCCQEHKLICQECKSHGSCQSHKTMSVEERASQLRVSEDLHCMGGGGVH